MCKIVIAIAGAALAWVGGCAKYKAEPLTATAVQRGLAVPDEQAIRVAAGSFQHPILKPLQLDMRRGLSPEEAAVVAVIVNPQLRSERDQRALATAQVLQAGLLPNPQLEGSVDFPHGSVGPGDNHIAYSIGPSWDITSLISHQAKKHSAIAEAASVDLDIAWNEWQVAEAAKSAAYDVLALTSQLQTAQRVDRQMAANLAVVRQALDRHQMTLLELAAAGSAAQEAHAVALSTQRDLSHERLVLDQAMGLPPTADLSLRVISLPSKLNPPSLEELNRGLECRRLDLMALKKGYESEEASLRATVLEQFPKINLGFNAARDTTDVNTFGVGVAIDIPVFDRNQGQIAIEKATRRKLFDEYVERVFDARSDIAEAIADIRSINAQIAAGEAAIPEMNRLVQTYGSALQQGNADVLSFYAARNDLEQKQIEVLKLKQQLMENWIALEIASGEFLPTVQTELSASARMPMEAIR